MVRHHVAIAMIVAVGGCDLYAYDLATRGVNAIEAQEMVELEGGPQALGCSGEPDCPADAPERQVELSAYLIDRGEVTQLEYQVCVDKGECSVPRCACSEHSPSCYQNPFLRGTYPVACVTWNQARKYCEFVGKRLPREAEWEGAAREGTGRMFPWSGELEPDCSGVNYVRCKLDSADNGPSWATDSGILALGGNVAEWVEDGYLQAPPSGVDPFTEEGDGRRVVRGGSFSSPPPALRSYAREPRFPEESSNAIGFRCARSRTSP